jgi:hypothetical protein
MARTLRTARSSSPVDRHAREPSRPGPARSGMPGPGPEPPTAGRCRGRRVRDRRPGHRGRCRGGGRRCRRDRPLRQRQERRRRGYPAPRHRSTGTRQAAAPCLHLGRRRGRGALRLLQDQGGGREGRCRARPALDALAATQFYDFILGGAKNMSRLPVVAVPKDFRCQPVDPADVADRPADLALGQPAGRYPTSAGPKCPRGHR